MTMDGDPEYDGDDGGGDDDVNDGVFDELWFQISLLYLSQDIYCWIPALAKYKTQPGTNLPPDKIKLGLVIIIPQTNYGPECF